ncbi:MAG: Gfo/Idh/MocA family oxidoreductase [Bacteroidia bacterium]|nr:Gfo/Idh/MocA family oxidoreductase [Bacteroidia bacterium]
MPSTRRDFIKTSAAAGTFLALAGAPAILRAGAQDKVRLGIIGTGLRGRWHLKLGCDRSDTVVTAICDIDAAALDESQALISTAGGRKAAEYGRNGDPEAWRDMLAKESLDVVIIATPWQWHTPQAVMAMEHGIVAGIEVPCAVSIAECWDLVNTYERTGTPCMIMENVCYRRDVMAVLNMVRQEMFGELLHLEGGYQHDLREVKFNDGKQPYGGGVEFGEKGFSEAKWRTDHSVHRNGDIYPTHGLGPVATMTNINRGNRFVSLSSTATKSRGLQKYITEKGGADHPNAKVRFALGDIVTTVLRTQHGETILLSHDTNGPRPYSLGFRVQGTQGIWMDINKSLYLEGISPTAHRWEEAAPYLEQYDHPLWQKFAAEAEGGGHGGMDFFVVNALIEAVKNGQKPPLDAYDAATWSAISPLSEQSIAMGSSAVEVPDFTRGKWMHRKDVFAG